MFKKIAIIGVGLIGGSIGIACRKEGIAKQVIGIGRRRSSINKAKRLGAIDIGTLSVKRGVRESDLIIVATPVNIVIDKIKECVKFLDGNAIIIDVTSIKSEIVDKADKIVKNKKGISFVGTHPMAGSEESGVAVARADLFKNSACIITPSKYTDKASLAKVKRFWQALGAGIKTMPASQHDMVVGSLSHLPHIIAFAVCASVDPGHIPLAGNSFRDLTRVAKSDPSMWADIFLQNKAGLKKALGAFNKTIDLFLSDVDNNRRNKLIKKIEASRLKRISVG
ncbi:MAG: prephenate dehydrogenase [Candidatus Omnitrophota bacterium]